MLPEPWNPVFGQPRLPEWVKSFRPHQWRAVKEILYLFSVAGKKVVFVDAPTGSGKTLIGEVVRRLLKRKSLYVCSTKTLQDQFLRDFPYAVVLKGRSNYPTLNHQREFRSPPYISADDCDRFLSEGNRCSFCNNSLQCPYEVAKKRALESDVVALNTAYFFTCSHTGIFSDRDLVIFDEADMLEQHLMSAGSIKLSEQMLESLALTSPPFGGELTPEWVGWVNKGALPALAAEALVLQQGVLGEGKEDVREARRLKIVLDLQKRLSALTQEMDASSRWIVSLEVGGVVFKPAQVREEGNRYLWSSGDSGIDRKFLCMSATLLSVPQIAADLGLDSRECGYVEVPSVFPKEQRPIYPLCNVNMTREKQEAEFSKLISGVQSVASGFPDSRILVHTHSYKIATHLFNSFQGKHHKLTYKSSRDREEVIAQYKGMDRTILFAPSLERGIDFPGDLCDAIIVAKMPYPNLGDPQIKKRLSMADGGNWYAIQTVRSLVQMTGRGFRSESDRCSVFILDSQFSTNVWRRSSHLFPDWWKESVVW